MSEAVFDKVGDQFVSYYETIRGHVREQLARRNLSSYINSDTHDVLDVGGGDGRDSIWLAGLGHRVTLVDPSPVMLSKAEESVKQHGLGHSVSLKLGIPEQVMLEDDNDYDLVLSHGVLMYVEDSQSHLNFLQRSVRSNGIVSILTKGKAGSLLRLLHKHDTDSAVRLDSTGRLKNNLGLSVLAVSEDTLIPMLAAARLSIVQTYGVRVATEFDYRPITDLSHEELSLIIDIEAKLGTDEQTKGIGQMLHFICKKEGE